MNKQPQLFPAEQYRIEDSVGFLLSRTRAKIAKRIDIELAVHDITSAQGGILMMLATGRFTTAVELAREQFIDSAAMTRMIDRLEKRGLIMRVRRDDDRRIINLKLTEDGQKLAQQLPAIYCNVLTRSFSGFTREEIELLKGLLRKLLAADVDE